MEESRVKKGLVLSNAVYIWQLSVDTILSCGEEDIEVKIINTAIYTLLYSYKCNIIKDLFIKYT
jgi:hypothetical protein